MPVLAVGAIFRRPVVVPRPSRYTINGITRDASGVPLPGCVVRVFEKESGLLRADTVSDATGVYALDVSGPDGTDSESGLPMTFQCVAYLPGSPDVAGVTVNTLVGTPS